MIPWMANYMHFYTESGTKGSSNNDKYVYVHHVHPGDTMIILADDHYSRKWCFWHLLRYWGGHWRRLDKELLIKFCIFYSRLDRKHMRRNVSTHSFTTLHGLVNFDSFYSFYHKFCASLYLNPHVNNNGADCPGWMPTKRYNVHCYWFVLITWCLAVMKTRQIYHFTVPGFSFTTYSAMNTSSPSKE